MTRSLTVHSIRIHKRRKPEEVIPPNDIGGLSIRDYFAAFCDRECKYASTKNETRRSMIECTGVSKIDSNTFLVYLSHARWGEESDVLRQDNYSVVDYHIGEENPTTASTRACLFVPEFGDVALYFCEYAMRGSAGNDLLYLFKKHLTAISPVGITVDINRVPSDAEWINSAILTELRLEIKKHGQNREDGVIGYEGKLSYSFVPEKLSSWPKYIKDKILGKKWEGIVEVADRLGVDVGGDSPKASVTLAGEDGKKTTFSLGDDGEFRAPYIREVIEQPSGEAFTDDQFCAFCIERAGVILDRFGR